jgi:hypothetical protein
MITALQTACGNTIAVCASDDIGRLSNPAADEAFYAATQTYNLSVVYAKNAHTLEDVGWLTPEAGYTAQNAGLVVSAGAAIKLVIMPLAGALTAWVPAKYLFESVTPQSKSRSSQSAEQYGLRMAIVCGRNVLVDARAIDEHPHWNGDAADDDSVFPDCLYLCPGSHRFLS